MLGPDQLLLPAHHLWCRVLRLPLCADQKRSSEFLQMGHEIGLFHLTSGRPNSHRDQMLEQSSCLSTDPFPQGDQATHQAGHRIV